MLSGVQPVLSAKDMANRDVEHLGVMAYAAHFQWLPERPPLHDLINVTLTSTSGRVGEPVCYNFNNKKSINNFLIIFEKQNLNFHSKLSQ